MEAEESAEHPQLVVHREHLGFQVYGTVSLASLVFGIDIDVIRLNTIQRILAHAKVTMLLIVRTCTHTSTKTFRTSRDQCSPTAFVQIPCCR